MKDIIKLESVVAAIFKKVYISHSRHVWAIEADIDTLYKAHIDRKTVIVWCSDAIREAVEESMN